MAAKRMGPGKSVSRKPPKPKRTARARHLSKKLKQHHAKAREIQKLTGVPYQTARSQVKTVFAEVTKARDRATAYKWLEVSREPQRFKRILPGRPRDIEYTFGKRRTYAEMMRSKGLYQYWAQVDLVAKTFQLSKADARKMISRIVEEMTITAREAKRLMDVGMIQKHKIRTTFRARDAAAVLINTDRYRYVREEFGVA